MEQAKQTLLKRDLPYELNMFEQAFDFIWSGRFDGDDETNRALRNMAVETFWLHARNLHEFLKWKRNKVITGVRAAALDFTEKNDTTQFEVAVDDSAINRQISHLFYDRPDEEHKKRLTVADMEMAYQSIRKAVTSFESRLPEDTKEKYWTPRVWKSLSPRVRPKNESGSTHARTIIYALSRGTTGPNEKLSGHGTNGV